MDDILNNRNAFINIYILIFKSISKCNWLDVCLTQIVVNLQ